MAEVSSATSSAAGASSVASSEVSSAFGSSTNSDFFISNALARSSLFSFSAANFSFSIVIAAFSNPDFLSATSFSFPSINAVNLFSASSSLKAPFATPTNKCFFIITPL